MNRWCWLACLCVALVASSCSVRRYATERLADALAGTGSTFARDNDPELIRDAAPFSLKLIESVLAETPGHARLNAAAASGFAQYAFAFVQQDADFAEDESFERAEALRARAKRLYLRARDYGMQGLDAAHPGFSRDLPATAATAQRAGLADVPLLYWTAASWAAAIALSKDDPSLVAELPLVEALIERAFALDEAFGDGALHTLLIAYSMSRPEAIEICSARAREHFEHAQSLSKGRQAAPYITLAESVSIQLQDREEFVRLLNAALAVDPDAAPEHRLANLILQRRARWLLVRTDDLFLLSEPLPSP